MQIGYGVLASVHSDHHEPAKLRLAATGPRPRSSLRCGVDVFGVLVGGEMLADAGTKVAGWAITRWCPRYSLGVVPVRPCHSVVLMSVVWMSVASLVITAVIVIL